MQHIFIVGSKGLGSYGGYETFVDKLTEYTRENTKIKLHIACKANGDGCMTDAKLSNAKKISDLEFIYNNAHCFMVSVPDIGSVQAIYYDIKALQECCKYIKKKHIKKPIIYILACRIGPFSRYFYKVIDGLGGRVFLNPDGHEWVRSKWSVPVRKYWKLSEKMMVKYCDMVICDSVNIEKYIHKHYDGKGINGSNPKTIFIAYGAETRKSQLSDNDYTLMNWYSKAGLSAKNYYLVVGRFVPENNYETMIREFMKSESTRDFVIITNTNDKFLDELEKKLHFKSDQRIKFVGTVYNQELLWKIRENAYGYCHGHEVGGTNPSLLEALGSTNLNLLLDVCFNREVAEDAAMYWIKKEGKLAALINKVDRLKPEKIIEIGIKAKWRIKDAYSWQYICDRYVDEFMR